MRWELRVRIACQWSTPQRVTGKIGSVGYNFYPGLIHFVFKFGKQNVHTYLVLHVICISVENSTFFSSLPSAPSF